MAPELPPQQRLYQGARRGIILAGLIGALYNTLGVAIMGFYIWMVFGDLFVGLAPANALGTIAVAYLVSWVLAGIMTRHATRFFSAPVDAIAAARSVPADVARQTFNGPFALAITTLVTWSVFGIMLYIQIPHATELEAQRHFVHIFWSMVFAANVVALCVLYHSENILWYWGSLEYSLQGRLVSQVGGIWSIPVWLRLLVFFVTTSLMPAVFLWMLHGMGELSARVFTFAFVMALILGTLQVAFLIFNISGAIGRIAARFREFRSTGTTTRATRVWRADALGQLAEMLDEFMRTHRERERIRSTFGRYVSEKVVDAILASDLGAVGARTYATIMFVDVRGFTTLSESLPPEVVVEILNAYLETMVEAITQHNGLPDKFIGDGILAVWGVPMADATSELNATQAAVTMLTNLEKLNQQLCGAGRPEIRIGIGLHAGDVVAGNIGSQQKLEYTVIGDTVNTCARIESATKDLGSPLAMSENVWQRLPDEWKARFEPAEALRLKGKSQPVGLYKLKG